jgi:hypothetical protein
MAGFGGLGGLGGATYPTRVGTPQSSVVAWAPDAISWRDDWQKRYDEEANKAQPEIWKQGLVELIPGQYATTNTATPTDNRMGWDATVSNNVYPIGTSPAYAINNDQGGVADSLNQYVDQQMQSMAAKYPSMMADPAVAQQTRDSLLAKASSAYIPQSVDGSQPHNDASHQVMGMVKVQDAYTPDFTRLNDEKTQMLPAMQNQDRLQQAYNSMMGWNQLNGVMSPNYTNPNFGQINGDFGQSMMGDPAYQQSKNGILDWSNPNLALAQAGTNNLTDATNTTQTGNFGAQGAGSQLGQPSTDTSWLSGVFNSLGGLAGVYGSPNASTSTQKKSWL